jgi:hypothetical protein
MQSASIVRFGAFELDLQAGELRKHGLKIKLQDQPFQILVMLLEQPGQVVTREQLHQKLWAEGTFVDFEHGLNAAIQTGTPRLPICGASGFGEGDGDRACRHYGVEIPIGVGACWYGRSPGSGGNRSLVASPGSSCGCENRSSHQLPRPADNASFLP